MAEQKGIGSKLFGIFVETEEGTEEAKAPLGTQADDEGAPAGPKLAEDKLAREAGQPTDFESIFRGAGMEAGELDRVKKAEELLKSLPEGTPQPVKKQIVEASLRAFGFEVEKIVQSAENQKRALAAYVKVNENLTLKATQEAEAQIVALTQKVAALREEISRRGLSLSKLGSAAEARRLEVQKVIDFFKLSETNPKT